MINRESLRIAASELLSRKNLTLGFQIAVNASALGLGLKEGANHPEYFQKLSTVTMGLELLGATIAGFLMYKATKKSINFICDRSDLWLQNRQRQRALNSRTQQNG